MMLDYDRLSQFMQDELAVTPEEFNADTPLFSSGLVDSFSLVSLMTFIETQAGITISPADVTLENFDTLRRIMDYARSAVPA
jgi:acyl carrier protein